VNGLTVDPKKLRILFLDDEDLPVIPAMKQQGFDVERLPDVENLDDLCDGRYQIIFFDVRGVGAKLGGTGLDVLKYVAVNNPMVYRIVYSAKPFEGSELELLREFSNKVVSKDESVYQIIEAIREYAKTVSPEAVISSLEARFKIGWLTRFKLKRGWDLSSQDVQKIAKKSSLSADAVKIVANCTAIAKVLIASFA
jgi:hypothetical protein